jgi:hypothetical protein
MAKKNSPRSNKNYLIKGRGWCVLPGVTHGCPMVFDPDFKGDMTLNNVARAHCAVQANEGNPDAIAAVLLCTEDANLQAYVREYGEA